MEDLLKSLMRDAHAAKFAPIRKSCQAVLSVLNDPEEVNRTPAYELREKCLEPLQLALESRAKRLTTHAVSGIEKILKDDRLQTSIETEQEERWLPIQILNAVYSTPNLPEDIQVDIMKLLLKMTFSTAWCMNARIITQVTQVYIDTYSSSSSSVKGAVQAALTHLLASFTEKLHAAYDTVDQTTEDVLSDFNAKGNSEIDCLTEDVVTLLIFLTDKVVRANKAHQHKLAIPLLLEGIHSILTNAPIQLSQNPAFQEWVWQSICPTLISLLGVPRADGKMSQQKTMLVQEDMGRGTECSTSCPNLTTTTARVIYSISVELAKMVGGIRSLRPVLESLFHRILLCSAPSHRHDALKAIKELLSGPQQVCSLTVTDAASGEPARGMSSQASPSSDLALLKLIIDSIQECCHSNDSSVCMTSVGCIDLLLGSVEQLSRGLGVGEKAATISQRYTELSDKKSRKSTMSDTVLAGVEDDISLVAETAGVGVPEDVQAETAGVGEPGDVQAETARVGVPGDVQAETAGVGVPGDVQAETAGVGVPGDVQAETAGVGVPGDVHAASEQPGTVEEEEVKDKEADKGQRTPDTELAEDTAVFTANADSTEEQASATLKSRSAFKSDQESAVEFIDELSGVLPYLLSLATIPEVDEALQKFSSSFSEKMAARELEAGSRGGVSAVGTILNADSVYTTAFTALCLNLNLCNTGFYQTHDRHLITMAEKSFLDSVLDTDMFLYVSPNWLSCVYRTLLTRDLLTAAGWRQQHQVALTTALKDVDGLGSHEQAGQMLRNSQVHDLYESHEQTDSTTADAGRKLSRYILSVCWDGILDVLSVLLNGKSSCGITSNLALMLGTEGAKEESMRARDAICQSLDGLQKAAKLCCTLGLQQRCGAVFAQLANTSCVIEEVKHSPAVVESKPHKSSLMAQTKPKLVRLHAAHILSMDAMMTRGLEMGSHSSDCWKHVFRCCAFISELEHTYFSSGNNQCSLPRVQQEQAVDVHTSITDSEMYGVPMAPVVPVAPRINVQNLIKQSRIESGWDRSIGGGGVLTSIQASQALCGLSQEVDKLFEEAASSLNMTALMTFLGDLCESSKQQLHKLNLRLLEEEELPLDRHRLPMNSLHLYRLQEVLMKVVHSDRPLLHLLKAWSVVSSYLVEAAGHRDRSISKMAVTGVHDYIITVMTRCVELPHFHTNEMLCKTFENILCLELCDGDVQDQIVCCICELVEASAAEIRSGWRPLFGALRAVRIEYTTVEEVNEARQRHIEAVLDVFDVYLNTDNIKVFASATVDCILCLLKYVRGPGEFEDSDEDSDSVSDYVMSSPASENLCIPALCYLKQCSLILQSMWKMPACPVFHGAQRIQVDSSTRSVDPNIPGIDFDKFSHCFLPIGEDITRKDEDGCPPQRSGVQLGDRDKDSLQLVEEDHLLDSGSLNSTDSGIGVSLIKEVLSDSGAGINQEKLEALLSLEELDNQTGILHVWFLLLEGLAGAISACPKSYQPQTMETLFELLRCTTQVPGVKFGVFCMKHLLLPMLQSWLRSGARKYGYWETGATNFKQCCGHTTDLVVDLIHNFRGDTGLCLLIETVLKELMLVLTECVAQPVEVISRLGCSCIRHVVLSAGKDFTEGMWETMTDGIQVALDVTTYCIRQLMLLFHANSESFYGDIGQVKVATRKDCSAMEVVRMWHLAQQVFLLDSQVSPVPPTSNQEEEKSFVFLLYPPGYENSLNPDHILARIPFRSIVVGLLSHQLLLQTVGCILLETNTDGSSLNRDSSMPGMLEHLPTRQVLQLLEMLHSSYKLACDFDLRPGLKFLIQKVAHTEVAVNLYKQAGASMVFYIHTLIKVCSNLPGLHLQAVRSLLQQAQSPQTDNQPDQQPITAGDTQSQCQKNIEAVIETDMSVPSGEETLAKEILPKSVTGSDMEPSGSAIKTSGEAHVKAIQSVAGAVEEAGDNRETDTCAATTVSRHSQSLKIVKVGKHGYRMKKGSALASRVVDNPGLFLSKLQTVCDELCQNYMDILYDKEGTSCVDSMAEQQLFFLIAQPDEFPEITKKPDLSRLNDELEQTQARLQGIMVTQAVPIQDADPPAAVLEDPGPGPGEGEAPPTSDTQHGKSKRELRNEQESRVYNLATDKLIKNLMTTYKKHKQHNSMPSFAKPPKKLKKMELKQRKKWSDPVEEVIEQQQKSSIMKDSEAHLQSWTELLCSILGLLQQLDDSQFTCLLPTVFPCVNHLVCHAQDMRLREHLAVWLHRVGSLFTLQPLGVAMMDMTEPLK